MTAVALRAMTDFVQADWADAVDRVVVRWARDVAPAHDADTATVVLVRMLRRETALAADRGAEHARRILTAAGARPAAAPRADAAVPVSLERTIGDLWRLTAAAADAERSRRAVVARVIDQALTNAWRDAMHTVFAGDGSVLGWRRVARPGCCGACLALANGRVMALSTPLWAHPYDRCIAEPVVRGVNEHDPGRPTPEERWASMTRAEQDAMFAGHGAGRKADLIRRGVVHIDDLVVWAPRDPSDPSHRQLPREATLQELLLDSAQRAALSHRTGLEFGADALTA